MNINYAELIEKHTDLINKLREYDFLRQEAHCKLSDVISAALVLVLEDIRHQLSVDGVLGDIEEELIGIRKK